MCNPPFFGDIEEKSVNSKSNCVATVNELVTQGGEVKFVSQIIFESLQLKQNIT